jgi:hypothetical protein
MNNKFVPKTRYFTQIPKTTLRNTFGMMRNTFGMMRNIFGMMRNIFGMMRNIFGMMRNTFGMMRNIFGMMRNTFGTMRNTFGTMRNTFGTKIDKNLGIQWITTTLYTHIYLNYKTLIISRIDSKNYSLYPKPKISIKYKH